jgi:hypothetical protein
VGIKFNVQEEAASLLTLLPDHLNQEPKGDLAFAPVLFDLQVWDQLIGADAK